MGLSRDIEIDFKELVAPPICVTKHHHPNIQKPTGKMPPIRTRNKRKPPPDGFEDIEDTLLEFENKMKDGSSISFSSLSPRNIGGKKLAANDLTIAENAPHDGKRRNEVLWPIFQISHQRT